MSFSLIPQPDIILINEGFASLPSEALEKLKDPRMDDMAEEINFRRIAGPEDGSYVLEIGCGGIFIESSSEKGEFNAYLTLAQIFVRTGSLPCCRVEDKPLFTERAVMLDVSRNRVYKMDYLKGMIRLFALLKYNQMQLYTEHTFSYEGHEQVWRDATPYTPENIRELDGYCASRGIELVPNQNSFGHMERWLKHPDYHNLAEAPEGYVDPWGVRRAESSTLWPANPDSLNFVKDLYDQLLPNFKSKRLNIGCDETFDLGKGRSADQVKEKGEGEIYLDFLLKLEEEVKSRGYGVQVWADILLNHPELVSRIPEDTVVVNWGYEADHPFEKETGLLAAAGRPFYVCTGTASWNSSAGRWDNAHENIRNAAYWARKNGAVGYMVTDWGDNGHLQQPLTASPGFLMAAQAAWNGDESFPGADAPIWTESLSALVFRDKSGAAADVLKKLALIWKENPVKLHNGSLFSYFLMDPFYPYCRESYEDCRRAGLGRAKAILAECESRVLGLEKGDQDAPFIGELRATLDLCALGVDFVSDILIDARGDWNSLDGERKASLLSEMNSLLKKFKKSWSLSSRAGGLDDSLEKLGAWRERLSR